MANGCTIDYVEQCVHLGTIVHSDITRKNIDSTVNDLFMRRNNLIANFSHAHSSTLSAIIDLQELLPMVVRRSAHSDQTVKC